MMMMMMMIYFYRAVVRLLHKSTNKNERNFHLEKDGARGEPQDRPPSSLSSRKNSAAPLLIISANDSM